MNSTVFAPRFGHAKLPTLQVPEDVFTVGENEEEKVLPIYITAIRHLKSRYHCFFQLVEAGDPSHNIKKKDFVQEPKGKANMVNLTYPPDSSDLNTIEARWDIL